MYSGLPPAIHDSFSAIIFMFYYLTGKGIRSLWMTVDSMGKDCPLRANALIAG